MKSKILLIALLVISVLVFNAFFPFKDHLQDAIAWFRALGPWAIVPYMILFVTASVFFIPISGMILVAGTLYGFWMGYLLVAASGLASVAVTYGVGKKLWRKRVEALRRENPRFESIYEAISRHGPILVFLIRLNPLLPFALLNYLFTIPKLDFRKYLLSSFLGMTPDIFFYLYVVHVGKGLLEDPSGLTVWNWLVLGAALGTTVLAAYIINRLIRKAAPPATPSGRGKPLVSAPFN
ncbi:MAG TPA: VTT domain-containing protein [Fibrobacteria bacterium]|nr:VTT domain-containing protein [Fibrobacteria bacterium]